MLVLGNTFIETLPVRNPRFILRTEAGYGQGGRQVSKKKRGSLNLRGAKKAWALQNPAAKNLVYSLLWQNTAERGRSRRDLSTLGSAWESLIFIN